MLRRCAADAAAAAEEHLLLTLVVLQQRGRGAGVIRMLSWHWSRWFLAARGRCGSGIGRGLREDGRVEEGESREVDRKR